MSWCRDTRIGVGSDSLPPPVDAPPRGAGGGSVTRLRRSKRRGAPAAGAPDVVGVVRAGPPVAECYFALPGRRSSAAATERQGLLGARAKPQSVRARLRLCAARAELDLILRHSASAERVAPTLRGMEWGRISGSAEAHHGCSRCSGALRSFASVRRRALSSSGRTCGLPSPSCSRSSRPACRTCSGPRSVTTRASRSARRRPARTAARLNAQPDPVRRLRRRLRWCTSLTPSCRTSGSPGSPHACRCYRFLHPSSSILRGADPSYASAPSSGARRRMRFISLEAASARRRTCHVSLDSKGRSDRDVGGVRGVRRGRCRGDTACRAASRQRGSCYNPRADGRRRKTACHRAGYEQRSEGARAAQRRAPPRERSPLLLL